MNKILSFIYQWLIFMPILVVSSILTAIVVILGSLVFNNHKFWGYVPPKYWSKLICRVALCKIIVRSNTNLDPNKSYVFVANHQGAFDIFLSYGYLGHNIKWVQKKELRKIPFVGIASQIAGHVFVDSSSVRAMTETIAKAERELKKGVSMFIFPEGARTENGKMARFKKGAYIIATQMQLPIVPVTLNGPFDVLKIHSRRMSFGKTLEIIIHDPISTEGLTEKDISRLIEETQKEIQSGLWEKYK